MRTTYLVPFAAALMLGGCVQIGPADPVDRSPIAPWTSILLYESEADVRRPFERIEDLGVPFEDHSRELMLELLQKKAALLRADAIILDRDFPKPNGSRDMRGLFLHNPEKVTGGWAIRFTGR